MNQARARIYGEIERERIRQDGIYGEPTPEQHRHGDYTWNAVLNEETGEVSRALLQEDRPGLRDELVQCAAVAVAWIECLDLQDLDSGAEELSGNAV